MYFSCHLQFFNINIYHIAHQIQQPILKLRIQIYNVFLANEIFRVYFFIVFLVNV